MIKLKEIKPGSIQHAAQRLMVCVPAVYKLIEEGKLRAFKIGRSTRITDQAIDECIAALEAKPFIPSTPNWQLRAQA